MGKLNDIEQKLLSGSTTNQLIKQGYAKSSVHLVANKLKNLNPDIPISPVPDEIQELRHQREIIKLQKEIAELETAKENLPNRVSSLESRLSALESRITGMQSLLRDAVDTALSNTLIYGYSLMISHLENYHQVKIDAADIERNERELREYSSGWVEKQIEKIET